MKLSPAGGSDVIEPSTLTPGAVDDIVKYMLYTAFRCLRRKEICEALRVYMVRVANVLRIVVGMLWPSLRVTKRRCRQFHLSDRLVGTGESASQSILKQRTDYGSEPSTLEAT